MPTHSLLVQIHRSFHDEIACLDSGSRGTTDPLTLGRNLGVLLSPMDHEAEEIMTQPEVTTETSLTQAVCLGGVAGVVGASLGWFLMSSDFMESGQAEKPTHQPSRLESSASMLDPIPAPSPTLSQESTTVAAEPIFYLQVAACRDEDSAIESLAGLRTLGFEARIQNDGAYHRLLVGPLGSQDAVSQASDRLAHALQSSPDIGRTIPGPWLTVQPSTGVRL
jgi:hypothetical protein